MDRSCNIPIFAFQIPFCRVQGFPGRATGAAAGEKRRGRGTVPLDSPYSIGAVHYQLPEFTETHVHRVSDAIQPSHPLSSPSINRLYLLAVSWLLTRFPHEYAIPILPVLPA